MAISEYSVQQLIEQGVALYEQGQLYDALVCWKNVLSIEPENPVALEYLRFVEANFNINVDTYLAENSNESLDGSVEQLSWTEIEVLGDDTTDEPATFESHFAAPQMKQDSSSAGPEDDSLDMSGVDPMSLPASHFGDLVSRTPAPVPAMAETMQTVTVQERRRANAMFAPEASGVYADSIRHLASDPSPIPAAFLASEPTHNDATSLDDFQMDPVPACEPPHRELPHREPPAPPRREPPAPPIAPPPTNPPLLRPDEFSTGTSEVPPEDIDWGSAGFLSRDRSSIRSGSTSLLGDAAAASLDVPSADPIEVEMGGALEGALNSVLSSEKNRALPLGPVDSIGTSIGDYETDFSAFLETSSGSISVPPKNQNRPCAPVPPPETAQLRSATWTPVGEHDPFAESSWPDRIPGESVESFGPGASDPPNSTGPMPGVLHPSFRTPPRGTFPPTPSVTPPRTPAHTMPPPINLDQEPPSKSARSALDDFLKQELDSLAEFADIGGDLAQPKPAAAPLDCDQLLNQARAHQRQGDFKTAFSELEQIFSIRPDFVDAHMFFAENGASFAPLLRAKLGNFERCPHVKLRPQEMTWKSIDHKSGFLLSQIDGSTSYDDLLVISGMSELEAMRILVHFLSEGWIE